MAATFVMTLPLIVLTLIFQHKTVVGLIAGAVEGYHWGAKRAAARRRMGLTRSCHASQDVRREGVHFQ